MSVWRGPFSKRGMDVALDLRGLTVMAFLARAADVLLKAIPDEAGNDSLLHCLASRV